MARQARIDDKTSRYLARVDPEYYREVSKYEYRYSVLGLLVGLACVFLGTLLFLAGVTGKMSWTARMLSAESRILDAAPGAVFAIIGLFVIVATRYVNRFCK